MDQHTLRTAQQDISGTVPPLAKSHSLCRVLLEMAQIVTAANPTGTGIGLRPTHGTSRRVGKTEHAACRFGHRAVNDDSLLTTETVAAFEEVDLLFCDMSEVEQARIEERVHIARALHDTLLQSLLLVRLRLGLLRDQFAADSPTGAELADILDLIGKAIEEGREAVLELRRRSGGVDLGQKFRQLRNGLANSGIALHFYSSGDATLVERQVGDELFQIGREALVNAICHSGSDSIELALDFGEHEFLMRIVDRGRGIPPKILEEGRDGHYGLLGMRERARAIHAQIAIASTGRGTEVELRMPAFLAYRPESVQNREPVSCN